jgi:hypothetical protein
MAMLKLLLRLCGILVALTAATTAGAAPRTVLFELFTNTG